MNALIKVIITSIIGFVGPLENAEVNQGSINRDHNPILVVLYIDPTDNYYCNFDELSCEKLNNNIPS